MSSKDQLLALGFEVTHSTVCSAVLWGKWFVGVKHPISNRQIAGYGADEEAAFADALKTASVAPVQNTSTNRH